MKLFSVFHQSGARFILPGTAEREAIVTDDRVLYVRDSDPVGDGLYQLFHF